VWLDSHDRTNGLDTQDKLKFQVSPEGEQNKHQNTGKCHNIQCSVSK